MQSNFNPEDFLTYGEVLIDIDQSIKPAWDLLLLIYACKKIAKTNDLTLREQLHTWRPFDV
tara:strand:+ start:335 stop:517 length:183 start_codon:yes stop_codon:yes gene_type:complete